MNFEFNTCMAQHDLSVSLFFCNYTFHAFSLCVSLFEKKIATMVTIFFCNNKASCNRYFVFFIGYGDAGSLGGHFRWDWNRSKEW